ncbi:myosin-binding protein 7-like [Forsythia ovata]|uniref:Myosin-binding protein 7-like n=1 Tax=Forsythia ovata TaxID=205694 RepID=A0ABD1SNZ0_9LAMI
MAEVDIPALKDMLCAQQQLLQKLYNELDAEREASSTAACEALSVILRLQGEKAAVKMEAEQYKRLAEEKMCHAEESLAIFEDVIYQKEMEVADLDYQLRAYRYKLLSTGCIDPGVGEIKFSENLLQRSETLAEDTSLQSIGRRNSVPISLKYSNPKKGIIDIEGSADMISKIVGENTGQEINDQASYNEKKTDSSTTGDINSYWEQIRKLDERVKEIAGVNYGNFRSETRSPSPLSSQLSSGNAYDPANFLSKTRSPSPQLSSSNLFDPKRVAIVNEIGETKSPGNLSENGSTMGSTCSLNVHDVFEVPRVDQNHRTCELHTKDEKKIACQGNESLEKADSVHPEAVKLCDKDEPDRLKKLLQSIHHENNLSTIDCRLAVHQATTSVSKLNQRNCSSEILDAERPDVGQESANRMEELKLLNEIKEQINSLSYEIRSWKMKKSSRKEELSLVPLMEDMLYFWL